MSHPLKHAENSARKFGGQSADYLAVHNWFDESKAFFADFRHRALRHHAEGIFLAERVFGAAILNSSGSRVPVRYIGEQHVKEDLGRIPTAQDWLSQIKPRRWMYGRPDGREPELAQSSNEPAEEWKAITHLYTDLMEIWCVGADGQLHSLVVEIPLEAGEATEPKAARARLIASAPSQRRALAEAPKPPGYTDAVPSQLEAVLLDWMASEYIPWYEGQRRDAAAKAQ